jgi:glycosyltransferase involved in cell wall biosynthesis
MRTTDPDTTTTQSLSMVGTYMPRRCGIATFSKDLRDAIAAEVGQEHARVVALDDVASGYAYPQEVTFQIAHQDRAAYRTAADLLNINQSDVAIIQHEYGIYGGQDGSYVIDMMRRLRMPIMTVLHTVLTEPSPGQRAAMREVVQHSDRLVVMSHVAEDILRDVYKAPDEKVLYIPHGIPDVPFVDPHFHKDRFGAEGRTVLLTFGLLSPGKGIETAIKALPAIVDRHPDVVYLVLGATHPNVLKREGNAYRDSLERLVEQLGMRDHVAFHNRFVSIDELVGYIGSADVYILPYPNVAQVVSGTLAYAAGSGKAIVSTPIWHARELLADGRGRLFEPGDCDQLAQTVIELLDNETERHAMRKRAYMHCRPFIWKNVARTSLDAADQILRERIRSPKPVHSFRTDVKTPGLPEVNLAHLRRMTDSTGMLQHAIYAIPDRFHGYCTDDNARALVAALMYHDLNDDDETLELADVYLSFLHHAFNPDRKRFRNFMDFGRNWLEDAGADDVHGRAIWALGHAAAAAPNESILSFATNMFCDGLEGVESLKSPRSWAFCLVGIHAYLKRFGGDTHARRIRDDLAGRLFDMFQANRGDDWPWLEDTVTYANAKLPHALILAGQWIPRRDMLEQGLRSLQWLIDLQIDDHKNVSLIGNQGWMTRGGHRARFDQQPIEAFALIEACAEAYRGTQDRVWIDRARDALGWFTGNNDTRSVLYDYETGGCRDGLHADGPNLNQGAESTLAWLISLQTVMILERYEELDLADLIEARPDAHTPADATDADRESDPATTPTARSTPADPAGR